VPWPDVNLPAGWLLNSRRVPMPPVPREGRGRHDEVCRLRLILPSDLRDDPTFAIDSYNWHSFALWEFDPRHQGGYLGAVGFFNRKRGVGLDDKEEDD
jgi:hypothetical protein